MTRTFIARMLYQAVKSIKKIFVIHHDYFIHTKDIIIRPSQTAAFPMFAANRKEVLNLSSQKDLVPN